MTYYSICPICKKRPALHCHHLYSQTRAAKKKYGKLIHHPFNLMYLCENCHLNGSIPKMTEKEFRIKLGLEEE